MTKLTLITFVVLLVISLVCISQALECGIDNESNQKDLKEIAENCMKKKSVEKKKNNSRDNRDEDDDEEMKDGSTERYKGTKKRNKRSGDSSENNQKNSDNNNGTASEKDNCVMHCVFNQLGMSDSEGFPIHHRVLQALLKNARNKELRDFVQDTTDECFRLMEQDDHEEPCQYSVTLVNCLAERGKSNCADWPTGSLPFLSKSN